MSRRTGRQTIFLRFLFLADKTQRKKLFDMATEEQIKAFREITLNIYIGHLIISAYFRTKLTRFKDLVQSLCDRRVSNSQIKKVLQKNGEIVPLILKPYFKEDGGGISTRQKNDLRSDEGETE